ncbi:glycosyltransferase family 2 protein [Demequina salsinemoris]|uniref:glycosyltransferase family 2 protein n=1 Tax=Demequina salsinemoris TaxID=577470 RepID=UPI000A04553D|nr:glycosyltransferase family 2 protein [Demequina salsinemoris]
MGPAPVLLSVVIVTYNSADVIRLCLGALGSVSDQLEVVVVDNASEDETTHIIRTEFPRVILVESATNSGFSNGVHQGVALTTGSVLCLLNPDAMITSSELRALAEDLAESSTAGVLAPLVVHPSGRLSIVSAGWQPTTWRMFSHYSGLSRLSGGSTRAQGHYLLPGQLGDERMSVEWVTGACMLISRACWQSTGGLSDRWFMYAEDIEFCRRASRHGYGIELDPRVIAEHAHGSSSAGHTERVSTAWIENLYDYFALDLSRNRLDRFAWRAIVGMGLAGRSVAYWLKSGLTGDETWVVESKKFWIYARSVGVLRRRTEPR